jgi:hypothetical protein
MPRHLISDAHEWINEIPTVPIYYLAKPQPRERAWQNQRGKKTLRSLAQWGLQAAQQPTTEHASRHSKMSGMVNPTWGIPWRPLGRLNAWQDIASGSWFRYMLVTLRQQGHLFG